MFQQGRVAGVPTRGPQARNARIQDLKRRIEQLERSDSSRNAAGVPFGVPAVDACLPGHGLAFGSVHEMTAGRDGQGAASALCALLLGRIARRRGPVLWVLGGSGFDPYPPGLERFGLPPGAVIFARAPVEQDRLWTMEEGLRCPDMGAVVGEVSSIDLTASRRLQLAAEAHGVTAFLLGPHPRLNGSASAARTRWRVEPAPASDPRALNAPPTLEDGAGVRWSVELVRARGGRPGAWVLDWRADRGLAEAALADRPLREERVDRPSRETVAV